MENQHFAFKLSGFIAVLFGLSFIVPVQGVLGFRSHVFLSQPWTIITSIFAHADYLHVFNNLFFLAVFGAILEHYIGSKRFLYLFFAGGVFANLSAFIFYPTSLVLGASGAVSAIIAALAVLKPRQAGLFFGVPLPMWAALLGWVFTNILGAAGVGGNTAYEAHLFGLVFGAVYGVYLRRHEEYVDTEEDADINISESTLRKWEKKYLE